MIIFVAIVIITDVITIITLVIIFLMITIIADMIIIVTFIYLVVLKLVMWYVSYARVNIIY